MARLAIIYYSATGTIAKLAVAMSEGAAEAGADVRLRRVAETAPEEAIAANGRWVEHARESGPVALAELSDLEWADGLAFGTPTRFGNPSAQLKAFIDTTGGLWAKGILADKVATSFTSSSTSHGGLEATILALNNTFYHWGSLVMPLGYGSDVPKDSGNPYGASFVSRSSAPPDGVSLQAAAAQGRRLARVSAALATATGVTEGG